MFEFALGFSTGMLALFLSRVLAKGKRIQRALLAYEEAKIEYEVHEEIIDRNKTVPYSLVYDYKQAKKGLAAAKAKLVSLGIDPNSLQ